MELQGQEGDEMPVPLNSTYVGGSHLHPHHPHHPHPHAHIIRHDHSSSHSHSHSHTIIPATSAPPVTAVPSSIHIPSNGPAVSDDDDDDNDHDHHHNNSLAVTPFKKLVKYRECLKNHAAAMGGNATDGCGEFMPSGEEGTLEALTCSACNCHRNFHRKEVEGETPTSCEMTNCYHGNVVNPRMARKLFMGHPHKGSFMAPHAHEAIGYHAAAAGLISSRPHQMIMSYNMGAGAGGVGPPSESDDPEDGGGGSGGMMMRPPQSKKRFRTKFTQEQKDKMLHFAERVGWKIQKQEESVVQQFCQEIGVKRRVLKVWMHNNKHNLGKKSLESNPQGESHV